MKVLLPTDGSESAKATLTWAVTTMNQSANEFILLFVVADPFIAEYEIEDAHAALAAAHESLDKLGAKVIKSEYCQGEPIKAICEYAEEEDVDLIVMGSHGRTGLAKILLGSVSEGVLEHARVPVCIYKSLPAKKQNFA